MEKQKYVLGINTSNHDRSIYHQPQMPESIKKLRKE